MSENFLNYQNESDWKKSASAYYQDTVEPEFTSDAYSAIEDWGYGDDERLELIEESLVDYAENYLDFIRENDIEVSVPYMVALDNGEVMHLPLSSNLENDLVMEEIRIALENSNPSYEGHKAVLISPNGIEKTGVITKDGFEEKEDRAKSDSEIKISDEEAIQNLKGILEEATSGENAVCYVTDVDAPALMAAIAALEERNKKKSILQNRSDNLER